jgi:hypothetical protein
MQSAAAEAGRGLRAVGLGERFGPSPEDTEMFPAEG